MITGCAVFTPRVDSFTPLTAKQSRAALEEIAAATNGSTLIKMRADAVFTWLEDNREQSRGADILYLWQPGAALRARIKYLGNPIVSILYDGEQWFLTDEINNQIVICTNLGAVSSPVIPALFFEQLADLPHGWVQPDKHSYTVARNQYAYRVTSTSEGIARELIFPVGSAVPSNVRISTDDGSTITAEFSTPVTSMERTAATFAPQLDGYTVKHLQGNR